MDLRVLLQPFDQATLIVTRCDVNDPVQTVETIVGAARSSGCKIGQKNNARKGGEEKRTVWGKTFADALIFPLFSMDSKSSYRTARDIVRYLCTDC